MAKYLSEAGLAHLWTNILKPKFASKVDKVTGKGLSSLDFTQTHLNRIDAAQDAITTLGSTKVDKIGGKGLSTIDLTNELAAEYAEKANLATFMATFAVDGWTGDGPYTQTLNISNLLDTDVPIADIILSDITITAVSQLESYSFIGRMVTGAGTLTAICYFTKPVVDLPIILKVVR